MRRPYGFVTIKPYFAATGFRPRFANEPSGADGTDLDAQPNPAVL